MSLSVVVNWNYVYLILKCYKTIVRIFCVYFWEQIFVFLIVKTVSAVSFIGVNQQFAFVPDFFALIEIHFAEVRKYFVTYEFIVGSGHHDV